MMWEMVKIKDVSKQIRGVSYKPTDLSELGSHSHLPVLRANNVTENGINLEKLVYVDAKCISASQLLKKGDILVVASSGSKSIVGRAILIEEDFKGSFGAFCKVVRPKDNIIDKNYLGFYFRSPEYRDIISNLSAGANINNLRNENIDDLEILLPPLSIQQKIAAILDKADALRRKDQALLKKYDDLAQAIFIDMFGDPVKNEMGWEVRKLGEVCDFPSGLVSPKISPYCDMFHVGGDNIDGKTGRIFGLKKTNELGLISGKFYFTNNHILYNKIRPYLNKVAVPDFEGICSADMYPLLAKERFILKEYLYFILRSNLFLDFADKQSRRANIPKINMKEMALFEFPVPDIEIQRSFIEKCIKLIAVKNILFQQVEKSESLFQSLLQQAFKGELV